MRTSFTHLPPVMRTNQFLAKYAHANKRLYTQHACHSIFINHKGGFIILIAIDHGNYAIKVASGDTFVSGLSEHSMRPPLAVDTIEWGGKHWTLTGSRLPYQRDKTKDDRFFILTLFAIARELRVLGEQPYETGVDLAVGLPPEHFSGLKDRFAEYFRRGAVKFMYNGEPVNVDIRQVFVYPQAYAAVVQRARSLMTTPMLFVIDAYVKHATTN